MFSQNRFGFLVLILVFVIVGMLMSGCIPASNTQTPILIPASEEEQATGTSPSIPKEFPTDTAVPIPVYTQPIETPLNDWQPVPADQALKKGNVFIDSVQLVVLESFPPQYNLHIKGSLPTPCHKLRVQIAEPDAKKRILVEIYTVVDPRLLCVQMLQAFDVVVTIPTPPGEFKYTIWVNGDQVGDIK